MANLFSKLRESMSTEAIIEAKKKSEEMLKEIDMDNFELNKQADDLVQTTSHYQLAKYYLQLEEQYKQLQKGGAIEKTEMNLQTFHNDLQSLLQEAGSAGIRIHTIDVETFDTSVMGDGGRCVVENIEVKYSKRGG